MITQNSGYVTLYSYMNYRIHYTFSNSKRTFKAANIKYRIHYTFSNDRKFQDSQHRVQDTSYMTSYFTV